MFFRHLKRHRMLPVMATAVLVLLAYVLALPGAGPGASGDSSEQLLTGEPWRCEVVDPAGPPLVATSVERFHAGGRMEGVTRLEDREAGRVLVEFRYRGVWQFDNPWLTEAIEEYQYLHVDVERFPSQRLAEIEAEFDEPEVSRVHALSRRQLVYGAERSLYQCHRAGSDIRV